MVAGRLGNGDKKGLALAARSAQRAGMMDKRRVVIVGGGAAGFFAAIACAEQLGAAGDVTIYEATAHPLAKVRVSGVGVAMSPMRVSSRGNS